MRYALIAVSLLAGCKGKPVDGIGSSVGSATGSGSATGRLDASIATGSGADTADASGVACPPSTRGALAKCLASHNARADGVADVERGMLSDIGLVRVTSDHGNEIYAIAKSGESWRAMSKVFYEDGHGNAVGGLNVLKAADVAGLTKRVTRIDYETSVQVHEDTDHDTTHQLALVCRWADNVAVCDAPYTIACTSKGSSGVTKSKGTLTIGADGAATYAIAGNAVGPCAIAKR